MTIVLDGSNGITAPGGTAAAPSLTTSGDTNTGIFFPAADTIAFTEGGAEAMRIDSSGNVGIGTVSPDVKLRVDAASPTRGIVETVRGTGSTGSQIAFSQDAVADWAIGQPAGANAFAFFSGRSPGADGTERARITSGGDFVLGIADNTYNSAKMEIYRTSAGDALMISSPSGTGNSNAIAWSDSRGDVVSARIYNVDDGAFGASIVFANRTGVGTTTTERARITTGGDLLVGKSTAGSAATAGCEFGTYGAILSRVSGDPLTLNRQTDDGVIVSIRQNNTEEGTISVSGTTVSYNGGHLSRYSQTTDNTRIPLLKGTVMTNLDQMAVWEKDGQPLPNEQLNCMKVSDVEGDVNVAGVFVNWDNDDDVFTNDMNIAMTGDMIIRIAQGVVVQRGELLMSAGDGTAKPQGDDIIRSKTVAKVTSNHVTCTYDDGSYCVPCVLMAC